VREGPGERLPWSDGEFDRVLSQLVLPFFKDAAASIAEMRRVARPGGVVAACMWGQSDEMQLIGSFWRAAARVDPDSPGDRIMRFRKKEETLALLEGAGLSNMEVAPLDVSTTYASFDELWQSLIGSAGTVGAYIAQLDERRLSELRDVCRDEFGSPEAPFTLPARAWAVLGRVPPP
jgi:SAM-dependent methyltransferase